MPKMNRRDFLETSAKGVALFSLPFFLNGLPSRALAAPAPADLKLNDYLTHFGVDESMIHKIMMTALEGGGDYCDVYFQNKISSYIVLEDKAVNRAYTSVDLGVGIRVLKGDQTGYSFTEDLSPQAMMGAAKTAANIASSGKTIPPVNFSAGKTADLYPVKVSWEDVKIDRKIPYLEKINDLVFAKDKRVIKVNVFLLDESSYLLMANSEGKIVFDFQPMGMLRTRCTAEQNGRKEMNGATISGRYGFDYLTPERIENHAREAVDRTIRQFEAVKPEAGEMPVVLAAGSSGILLHEAMGHPIEADFNRKNASIFSDKIGKPVAEKFVSIVDDGTMPGSRGAINVDDELNESKRTVLIENGTLVSYMHDRISANYYKVPPTGNGRRESFRYPAIPRMRNTYMLPGPHKKDEIIKSVKKGLYAESFTNGEVYIGAGDFTFYVKSGYLIEDGKLTTPVKDINIIGNGPDVLSKITMVGDDLAFSEESWTCGKDGQGVPVSLGLPTVKVSSITVGGKS